MSVPAASSRVTTGAKPRAAAYRIGTLPLASTAPGAAPWVRSRSTRPGVAVVGGGRERGDAGPPGRLHGGAELHQRLRGLEAVLLDGDVERRGPLDVALVDLGAAADEQPDHPVVAAPRRVGEGRAARSVARRRGGSGVEQPRRQRLASVVGGREKRRADLRAAPVPRASPRSGPPAPSQVDEPAAWAGTAAARQANQATAPASRGRYRKACLLRSVAARPPLHRPYRSPPAGNQGVATATPLCRLPRRGELPPGGNNGERRRMRPSVVACCLCSCSPPPPSRPAGKPCSSGT